jgi:ATP-grasp domain/L-amino acid ligase C-terminal domain 2
MTEWDRTIVLIRNAEARWVPLFAEQIRLAGLQCLALTPALSTVEHAELAGQVDTIVVVEDVYDPDALAATVRSLTGGRPPAGVLTGTDETMLVAARTAALLGVARVPYPAVELARNKYAARVALAAAGLAVPRFALLRSLQDAADVAAEVGLPAVIKPVNGTGSNLVRMVRSVAELAEAYELLAARLPLSRGGMYGQPVPGPDGSVLDPRRDFLVESCLVGREYCLDVVVRSGEVEQLALVDKPLMDDRFFEQAFVSPPFDLAPEREASIRATVVGAVRALGLDDTVAHVELIDDLERGPTIVEVNAGRPGGHLLSLLNRLRTGVNLFGECVAAAAGRPRPAREEVKLTIPLGKFIVYASGHGRLVAVHGLDAVAAIPEVIEVVPAVRPGDLITDEYEICAVNLLVAGFFDLDDLLALYREVSSMIRLELEPVLSAVGPA